jgi:hypothetical protein
MRHAMTRTGPLNRAWLNALQQGTALVVPQGTKKEIEIYPLRDIF